ncbi:helicase RepA family protein [Roseomonas sp. GC11]|uniref:AAA family ATPase n=1 Tax=Roseomonas sp. GC11 TaxID=2950546 RepID=UPI00210C9792|nr:AAA family ATPase [Roseomonas sp. GC11]MCQ4161509.1 helicase RepA family protein [Roseomonas sp. GC11]
MDGLPPHTTAAAATAAAFARDRAETAARAAAPDPTRRPLRLLLPDDLAVLPPRQHLLAGLLGRGELSVIWGAAKTGKSFLAMRLAYGLACGIGMWGRAAARCRALYVAAEGAGGLRNRVAALRAEMGDAGGNFAMVAQPITIGPPCLDLAALVAAARGFKADLIVLDTLARTFGEGDENSARDMAAFVAALDHLRVETGAHVLVIHHGAKSAEATSPRGSGALVGAADLVARVERGADGAPHLATVTDAKDDEGGAALPFRLRRIDLPPDADGAPRASLVAEEAQEVGAASGSRNTREDKITPQQATLVQTLRNLVIEGAGSPVSPLPGMPKVEAVARQVLRERLILAGFFPESQLPSELPSKSGLTDAGYKTENRALERLKEKGILGFSRDLVWVL